MEIKTERDKGDIETQTDLTDLHLPMMPDSESLTLIQSAAMSFGSGRSLDFESEASKNSFKSDQTFLTSDGCTPATIRKNNFNVYLHGRII